jgi:hypothetical protein
MRKSIYLYVCDTMADWEPSFVVAELHSGRYFKDKSVTYEVKTVSVTPDPITTMGGVHILPDLTVDALTTHGAGLLILPGGIPGWIRFTPPSSLRCGNFWTWDPCRGYLWRNVWAGSHGFSGPSRSYHNDLGFLKMICPTMRAKVLSAAACRL